MAGRALVLILAVLLMAWTLPARAVEPDEILSDPKLEERARDISAELRCLVCQNQSIDDSNAPLARDLRILVRERLTQGDSDSQVIDFVVARYGEFVLLNPRFAPHTYLLWLGPPLILLIAVIALIGVYRRRDLALNKEQAEALSAAEKRKLKKLLDQD
jgi:cytochrome c-type biogenesis protein CcmH